MSIAAAKQKRNDNYGKRPYGKIGEQVTVIGLGGEALNKHSFTDGVATVRQALELGVNYFVTSPIYAQGASQAILGEALQGRPEPHLLATKLGYFSRQATFRTPAALSGQLDDNLRLLRREPVDVLQVHESDWHNWWSDEPHAETYLRPDDGYDFANAPVMQFLRAARDEGRCQITGITGNGAANVARRCRPWRWTLSCSRSITT